MDKAGRFVDKTAEVARYDASRPDNRIEIVFTSGPKPYLHGPGRALILHNPVRNPLPQGCAVEVVGTIWTSPTEVWTFTAASGSWRRIFYVAAGREKFSTYPAENVRIIPSATETPTAASILTYFHSIAMKLSADDALRRGYDRLGFIHPESALGRYLTGAPVESRALTASPIFPFRCNLSQRDAVENGLTRSVSVIEGPPGTGKTETILNLVANIISTGAGSVGVVSFSNAAVDNVREKLDELGFAHVIGRLGRKEKREVFFAGQEHRNQLVDTFVKNSPTAPPDLDRYADVDRRVQQLQSAERTRAELRKELDAYRLELRHFEQHLERHEAPDLEKLPLLRRSAGRILDYLAETQIEHDGAPSGLVRRIIKYFMYGPLRGLDPDDTDVILRLQQAYYDKRVAELRMKLEQVERQLQNADFDQLVEEHRRLSSWALMAQLGTRYRTLPRTTYEADKYRLGKTFPRFIQDYPVLLSTCHSFRDCIPNDYILDYLIIDEASQVDLLAAGLAMSSCRNLIVVGDLKQLPPVTNDIGADATPPAPAYSYEHSILSSLTRLHGEQLPRTLLREHYRCDPAIIGFCNKSFYEGSLIPYTTSSEERPMIAVRTVAGNHMRQHRSGGRSNQREIDVIASEVIPQHCNGVASSDIGITTPYRPQADRVTDALIDQVEADTVHKYQGRQKEIVILTTVLDETWRGRRGLKFADDPNLINVAVSRAIRRFILVTNHAMLPTSRNIRDLVGYIRYHNPDEDVVDSAVISMFDLLYRDYSARLRPLAARLRNEMAYKSEDITWTVLNELLAEAQYSHLTVSNQVLLRNLLFDLSRLTTRQKSYIQNRASVDFVVYNRITNYPLLAIEVDGFAYHENNPRQLERDAIKNEIFRIHSMPLLRLPTTGSGEENRIRQALDAAEAQRAQLSEP